MYSSNYCKELLVYKLDDRAKLPTRAHAQDAGIDLYSIETRFIPKGTTNVVKTGVAIRIPDGYIGKLFDRSSMARDGLLVGGGVIDAGYTGEVSVVIHNLTYGYESKGAMSEEGMGYWVHEGQKIAQLVVSQIETPEVVQVHKLWNSERGEKGFGSSGK